LRTARMMYSIILLSGERLREREMAEAQEEVSSVVVLVTLLACVKEEEGCMNRVLQLCEDAVESCTGAAGGGEWDPWYFRLEWGVWLGRWRDGFGY